MQRKQVLFIADSLDNAHKFQQILSAMDVDVSAGSSLQFKKLLSGNLTDSVISGQRNQKRSINVSQII